MDSILLQHEHDGVCTITLNRPEVANAFNLELITALAEALAHVANQPQIRVIVLTASGDVFCSGGDLNWMAAAAHYDEQENYQDALRLANLLRRLDTMPQVTIARINGAAFGGGLGLICCCDIAIAVAQARFAFSELKLGLVPATIYPYAHRAIGGRNARRYFLTAEVFDVETARAIGVLHEYTAAERLNARIDKLCRSILSNGPEALRQCKAMLVEGESSEQLAHECAQRLARSRSGAEAREGIEAFLQKRKASWIQKI